MVTTISRLVSVYKFLKCDYGIINPPKGPMASDYLSEMSWFTPIALCAAPITLRAAYR